MSFTLINPIDNSDALTISARHEVKYPRLDHVFHFDLLAYKNIWIEALSFGIIPHQVQIRCEGPVLLISAKGMFLTKGLLIETTLVESGSIVTTVFNMNSETIRIGRAEVVSQLVAL